VFGLDSTAYCGRSSETLGSIKGATFLDQLTDWQHVKRNSVLCSSGSTGDHYNDPHFHVPLSSEGTAHAERFPKWDDAAVLRNLLLIAVIACC
jgi:hypothetical protein